jgi:hypothetical protein
MCDDRGCGVARFVRLATVLACSPHERTNSPPALRAAPDRPGASAAAPAAIPARQLPDEIPIKTRSGAALLAPKGWWLTHDGEVLLPEDPDAPSRRLLEISEPDAARAIDAA